MDQTFTDALAELLHSIGKPMNAPCNLANGRITTLCRKAMQDARSQPGDALMDTFSGALMKMFSDAGCSGISSNKTGQRYEQNTHTHTRKHAHTHTHKSVHAHPTYLHTHTHCPA